LQLICEFDPRPDNGAQGAKAYRFMWDSFTCEMADESTGLLAAAFMGIVPGTNSQSRKCQLCSDRYIFSFTGYISRSVAGSYDNEAIAIFLLMYTFYLWIRAVKEGSAFWGMLAAVFYGWMVAAWGGYVFITNMIPLHAFVLVLMGRFSHKIYISYSSWYVIGTLASMQVPFVGFLPVRTSEHMAALGESPLLHPNQLDIDRLSFLLHQRCLWVVATRRVC
jgi:dolichyl-diphosphooligosaccharide--protein glycosyltransferase